MTKEDIQVRRDKKMTYQEIADELGVSRQRVHQVYKDYKPTDHYILKKVYRLHGYKCVICGKTKNIEVHHLDGVKTNNEIINLSPLCRKHHRECEAEERKKLGLHKRESNAKRLPDVERFCSICSTIFVSRPYTYRKWCFECSKGKKWLKRTTFNCLSCGKEKTIATSVYRRQGGKFCSRGCSSKGNSRRKYATREEARAAELARSRKRYAEDVEYREKSLNRLREYNYRKKAEKQQNQVSQNGLDKQTNERI